jgi:hypothetical protein
LSDTSYVFPTVNTIEDGAVWLEKEKGWYCVYVVLKCALMSCTSTKDTTKAQPAAHYRLRKPTSTHLAANFRTFLREHSIKLDFITSIALLLRSQSAKHSIEHSFGAGWCMPFGPEEDDSFSGGGGSADIAAWRGEEGGCRGVGCDVDDGHVVGGEEVVVGGSA